MFDRILPIGSVINLVGGTTKLMILGYSRYSDSEQNEYYDYCGCIYPTGYTSADNMYLFNHKDIEHIYALGFQNETQFEFSKALKASLEELDKKRNGTEA